tara:strand:- start:6162 stop:6905 length:744 start_codon:yes stop_codon:yes gene_type:complete
MITQSFTILEGVSEKTDLNIKDQGIVDWQGFLDASQIKGISLPRKKFYERELVKAKQALFENNASYFASKVKSSETWKLFEFFKDECVYLDIETDGLSRFSDVTVVGLYDGFNTKMMIKDINLDFKELKKELSNYKMIVTFNGNVFDLPFIEKRYPGTIPDVLLLDLRFMCDKVGLSGGLKEVERVLGIKRNKVVEDLYGGDALRLWKMYKTTGDDHYLNLLLEYNEEDIVNLEKILGIVISRLKNS